MNARCSGLARGTNTYLSSQTSLPPGRCSAGLPDVTSTAAMAPSTLPHLSHPLSSPDCPRAGCLALLVLVLSVCPLCSSDEKKNRGGQAILVLRCPHNQPQPTAPCGRKDRGPQELGQYLGRSFSFLLITELSLPGAQRITELVNVNPVSLMIKKLSQRS